MLLYLGHSLHLDVSNQHDDEVLDVLSQHTSVHHDNVIFSSLVYAGNDTRTLEHVGYVFAFNSTVGPALHTVITDKDSLAEASEALTRFNGVDQVFGQGAQLLEGDNVPAGQISSKRDYHPYAWATYTGWGADRGYVKDLDDWNQYPLAAQAFYNNWRYSIISQTQGCSDSRYCYGIASKWCQSIGFSVDMGYQDAEVGEVHIQSYGGLDYDCVYG